MNLCSWKLLHLFLFNFIFCSYLILITLTGLINYLKNKKINNFKFYEKCSEYINLNELYIYVGDVMGNLRWSVDGIYCDLSLNIYALKKSAISSHGISELLLIHIIRLMMVLGGCNMHDSSKVINLNDKVNNFGLFIED